MSLEELRSTFDDERSPLNDLPGLPPDPFAYLADKQIRREHIDAMCIEANNNWPDIVSIECGVHSGYPYIAIRISPYDDKNVKQHNAFITKMRILYAGYASVSFYCLVEDPPYAVNTATQLYKRVS